MTTDFKLFVASPSDVKAERDSLDAIVCEINATHGEPLGYQLQLVRWETCVVPGAGRPQQVINDQIGAYDLFLGIMWRRFGTPTGVAESGTEEEYRIAYRAWEEKKILDLMFYFCKKPFMPCTIDELDQMRSVLNFRHELEGKAIVWDYKDEQEFPNIIRQHLCKRLTRAVRERQGAVVHKAVPDDKTIFILRDVWPKMDQDLQQAVNMAYNENRLKGDAGIQTRDLFAALMKTTPPTLKTIIDEIPQDALPEPISSMSAPGYPTASPILSSD
jgi:hypothetical protein